MGSLDRNALFDWENLRTLIRELARCRLPRRLAAKVSASDVAQITSLRLVEHQDQFRGQTEGEKRCYARTIADRIVIDLCRERKRCPPNEMPLERDVAPQECIWIAHSAHPSPSSCVVRAEQLGCLEALIHRLPTHQRMALWKRTVEGKSRAQIASDLETSRSAVDRLLHRARVTLRKWLSATDGNRV